MTTSPPPPHHYQINTTVVTDGISAGTTATSTIAPWSSKTNWKVSGGSLDSAVTLETFDFPIDSEFNSRKEPLLLVPSHSSDFQPCEIKINFTQKHEIRQIYVKSTARVYEIYYAPALQSDNEYLCTVRCSAASVEDSVYPLMDIKEAVPVNMEGPSDIILKRSVAGENIIGTNEDDWVEIKSPVGRLDEGNTCLPYGTLNNTRNYQNYHEATAEINDSEPCMSLTLRLLSLQNKGCVYVDEVYVFADPIDTNALEDQTVSAESSTGSSLMTMLVPTLLGLSKSQSLPLHEQHSSTSVGKSIETESKPSASANPVPDNRAEILLEQLVSRVSRIEDICMRFEVNMLKPINSMEARLQRVEQQIELLSKNPEFPVSSSSPKLEPNPRLIRNNGNDSRLCSESESDEIENELFAKSSELPSESPRGDEKVEENPKKPMSIDDALAAALAGFSSFTKANDSLADEEPIDTTTLGSNDEDSISCNSLNATTCEFTVEQNDDATKSNEFTETSSIMDDFYSAHDISVEILDNHSSIQGTSEVLDFDKTEILKYFSDATVSSVDFESPILEVKFASLENGSLKSHLEALLCYTDDPVTDGDVLITPPCTVEGNTNNFLVEVDGDGLQQDLSFVHEETSFVSLI